MNHHEDPCIYGLTYDGRVFYVGYTSVNALNRWWQHRYRARSGHSAPVYEYMRAVGIDRVGWEVIEQLTPGSDHKTAEASHIARLIGEGFYLVNQMARNGIPDSWSEEMRNKVGNANRGRPSWIKGKRGEEAGWTQERKDNLAKRRREDRVARHGSVTEYRKHGCRCEECSGAMRAYLERRQKSEEKKPVVLAHERPTPKWQIHGEVACYKNGKCRCDLCATAYREYQRSISKTPEEKRRPHQYKGDGRIDASLQPKE